MQDQNPERQKQIPLVLYVDDEQLCCRYFARLCKGRVDIRTFTGGAAALAFLREESGNIHMVISDQRMPGMSGAELLTTVRSEYPRVTRVLTTGFSGDSKVEDLKREGLIDQCLCKPWNVDDVLSLIGKA